MKGHYERRGWKRKVVQLKTDRKEEFFFLDPVGLDNKCFNIVITIFACTIKH